MTAIAEASRPEPAVLAVANAWPPMAAGTGRALRGMLGDRPNTVVLAPRAAATGTGGGATVLGRLRFAHRARGPFKIHSFLQHVEIVLAPLLWCARRRGTARPSLVVCIQPLFAGVGGMLTQWLFGVPYVVLAYGEELTTWLQDPAPFRLRLRLLRAVLARAATVVVTSEKTRALARDLHAVPDARLRVIYPAIDISDGRSLPPAEAAALRARLASVGEHMVLMVGRLAERHKGFDTAIAALPVIAEQMRDVRLIVAGPGPQDALRAQALAGGVASQVTFLGHVDERTLQLLFAACDVFLLPGREVQGSAEGFGVVFLEAALAGKPVIGGRVGGVPEAIVDGETGLLVDGRSSREVGDAVVRLLQDPAYAAMLGAQGRTRVLRDFDGRRQHAQFAEVVRTAARASATLSAASASVV